MKIRMLVGDNNLRLLFLLLIISTVGNSQNIISGTAVDKTNNAPIHYLVTVGIAKRGIATNTNLEGAFRLLLREVIKTTL